jgi:hypothetical protein
MANIVTTSTAVSTLPNSTPLALVQVGGEVSTGSYVGLASLGGNQITAISSASTANTVIKNARGVLATVLVTSQGSTLVRIFDHPSASTGTIVGIVPSNAPVGWFTQFSAYCSTGILVEGSSQAPAMTIGWI